MDSFYVGNKIRVTNRQEERLPIYDIRYPVPGTPVRPTLHSFPLKNKYNRFIKRSFDIVLSVILIIAVLSWLIPLFAIIIKLDSRGPVFFRQKRNRNAGKIFTCIKFRTMIVNEEADHVAARENDERITAVGKFLRHYHIDELPQLFNVFMGDMSIIGPRPHMLTENLYYESLLETYTHRHTVRPGITGLAQSLGYFGSSHNFEKVKERVGLDIMYIQNWSMGMDIKIIYRTLKMTIGSGTGEKSSASNKTL